MADVNSPAGPPPGGLSPLAKRLARIAGVDSGGLSGSGSGGRILAEDVLAALPADRRRAAARPLQTHDAAGADALRYSRWRLDCDAAALLQTCERLARWQPRGIRITPDDLLLLIVARAVVGQPLLGSAAGAKSVSVAVAVGDATPVIRNAAARRLSELAALRQDLTSRARAGDLRGDECGADAPLIVFFPPENDAERIVDPKPPRAAALAFGAPQRLAAKSSSDARLTMRLSLAGNDPHAGGRFLEELRRLVEDPRRLLL